MQVNCMIVDDEPIAREILRTYIAQVPYLHLIAECSDAFEAMRVIRDQPVDLIILDINMPRLTGLDMLRSMKKYPAIIITSAHSEHALEGFELSVTDYLLKPFSFPRFVQATEKIVKPAQQFPGAPESEAYLMIKADKKLTKVLLGDIMYVEAYGNYIFIYRGQDRIMSKQTLTQIEEQLPAASFVRIHKSYIVSLRFVKFLEGNEVSIGSKKLPVGKVFKENLLKKLAANS